MEVGKINEKKNNNISKIVQHIIFKDESYFQYVFNKSERIVTALHMVTNYFPHNEPLRIEIRRFCLELVSLCLQLSEQGLFARNAAIKNLERLVLKIVTLLEISFHSRMVSEMNHSILYAELDNLLTTISSLEKTPQMHDEVVFSETFFNTPESVGFRNKKMGDIEEEKKASDSENKNHYAERFPVEREGFSGLTSKGHFQGHDDFTGKKAIHKNVILSLLKRKETLSIKDVSAVITDCSEKTLQRELQALVDQNVLNKGGVRRWTRYFLPKV